MKFSSITGQRATKERLLQSVQQNKVSHAQILFAPEGAGGLPLAIAYAQYLNCSDRAENDSCGQCSSCIKMQKLIHPDVHFSYPVIPRKPGDKPVALDYINEWRKEILNNPYLGYLDWMAAINAENKQGNITISECHNIIRKFSLKAFEGGYKILIMWLPEFLGKEGNALLKLLEEPPERTVFLLVSQDQEKILSTILSRTQALQIPRLKDEEVQQFLIREKGISQEEAGQLSHLAEGNLNQAMSLSSAEKANFLDDLRNWMRICYTLSKSGIGLLKWVDSMAGIGRENQKNFLRYATHLFRECLLQQHGLAQLQRMTLEEQDFIGNFSKQLDDDKISQLTLEFDQAHYHVERNANPKITFFNLSLTVYRLLRQKPVAA
ncbi:MAG: hypothetical protein WD077_11000 [Bacteroidia bacterium]